MRRSILKKLAASIVLVTAIIFSGLPVFAQHRSHQDEKHYHDKKAYSKRTKDNRRNNKKDYHSRSHKKNRHHDERYSKVKSRRYHGDHYDGYRIKRHHTHRPAKHIYRSHAHNKHVYHAHGHHKHVSHRYYKRHGHRCYAHPGYGNVVVRFAVAPIVINHYDGDFFYTDGLYYQYYPEVGYVRVEAPNSIYFGGIPDKCERVSCRGQVYFKFGDLRFVKDGRGFRLAGSIEL